MKSSTTPTYVMYLRCSTEEQAKGFSHDYQLNGIQNDHRVKEWRNLGIFKEAASGRSFENRKELDEIYDIYSAAPGVLKYLLIYRWDRLGRDSGDCFNCVKRFEKIGVEVNCLQNWINYATDDKWPLMLGVEFGLAHSESNKISTRTCDGLYASNCAGYFTGRAPAGYNRVVLNETRANGKRRKILVPDEKAHIVKLCIEQYVAGIASKSELLEKYGKTLGLKKTAFYAMFSNPIYAGQVVVQAYKGKPSFVVEGQHEAIISRDLLERSLELHDSMEYSKKKSKVIEGSPYYAKRALRCIITGSGMTGYGVLKKKSNRTYYYYRSIKRGGQSMNIEQAHKPTRLALQELTVSPQVYAVVRDKLLDVINGRQRSNKEKIKKLTSVEKSTTKRLSNLQNLLADGDLTVQEYRTMKDRYALELKETNSKLATLKYSLAKELDFRMRVLDMMVNLSQLFRMTNNTGKTRLLRAIFPAGYGVDADNQIVLTPRLNTYLNINGGKSETYRHLRIESDLFLSTSSVVGRKPNDVLIQDKALLSAVLQ